MGQETGTPHVVASACFALIRRWRDTFPLEGEGYYARCDALGGTSNNGDPACWRPARGAGFDCAALFGCRARP